MNARGKLRVMIVDDEELARHVLRELLSRHPDVEIVAQCADGFEAVKSAMAARPDLLFLDVQMPRLNGFEVLELLGADIATIFVTAYDEFALRAFEVHAVDYLLKPFTVERFESALASARRRIAGEPPAGKMPPPQDLAASARPPDVRYLERIVVRDGTRVTIIPVAKLDYAEAQDDYVALASQGRKHLKQQTISALEAALDPNRFLRIHRSYIVNLERVARVEPYAKDSRIAILTDGSRLPVSRAGYARLRNVLDGKG